MEAVMTKPESIMVVGKRWFSRGPGNTYHSANIYVDGKQVHRIDFAYGYGDQDVWNAAKWLEQNGYMPGRENYDNGGAEAIWRYCEKNGIQFSYEVSDVQRKKDL